MTIYGNQSYQSYNSVTAPKSILMVNDSSPDRVESRLMGNDLQKERESPDVSQQIGSEENNERSSSQQAAFSSCVDPPRLQYTAEIEDPDSTVAPSVMISKPDDASKKESDLLPNICISQSSQSRIVQKPSVTTPLVGLAYIISEDTQIPRLTEIVPSDQGIKVGEVDIDNGTSQQKESASVSEPHPLTSMPPTKTIMISSDTEHQKIAKQSIKETRKSVEQSQFPLLKTDGAVESREEISTIIEATSLSAPLPSQSLETLHEVIMPLPPETQDTSQQVTKEGMIAVKQYPSVQEEVADDSTSYTNKTGHKGSTMTGNDGSSGSSKTGHSTMTGSSSSSKTGYSIRVGEDGSSGAKKTGHSTGTKRKHRTATHKRQHGELTSITFLGNISIKLVNYCPTVAPSPPPPNLMTPN